MSESVVVNIFSVTSSVQAVHTRGSQRPRINGYERVILRYKVLFSGESIDHLGGGRGLKEKIARL